MLHIDHFDGDQVVASQNLIASMNRAKLPPADESRLVVEIASDLDKIEPYLLHGRLLWEHIGLRWRVYSFLRTQESLAPDH